MQGSMVKQFKVNNPPPDKRHYEGRGHSSRDPFSEACYMYICFVFKSTIRPRTFNGQIIHISIHYISS